MLTVALVIYASGVLIGLWRVDAAPMARVAIALLWPLGAAAGVVTVAGLVVAAMVLFPGLGAGVVLVAAVIWWAVS